MYTSENISTILDFRYHTPTNYEDTGNRPSDELILDALDLVRKLIKCPEPYIILGMDGLDTVVKFIWNVGSQGVIQYTLSEDYLKLFVIDDDGNILVNNEELNHEEYVSIDLITKYYIREILKNDDSQIDQDFYLDFRKEKI